MNSSINPVRFWQSQVVPQFQPLPSWLAYLVLVLALAAFYVVTARLGLTLALPPAEKATAVWPPSGIALAAVLIFGYRAWPGIWLGAFSANLWDFFSPANEFSLAAHLILSGGIAVGSTLQPLIGTYLLRRWIGQQSPLGRAQNVFRFLGVALIMCVVASTIGVTTLYLLGFAPLANYGFNWWTWWLGDTAGVIIVTPLILAWSQPPSLDGQPRRLAEAGLLLGLLLIVQLGVFGGWNLWGIDPRFLLYLTVPPLVWAAFRFGQHGATAALLLVSGFAVWGTAQDHGPFGQEPLNESLLLLQAFMGVLTVTALTVAGVLSERKVSGVALQQSAERLHLAQQSGRVGIWDWNVLTQQLVWDGVEPIHGLEAGAFGGSVEAYLKDIHPEDRNMVINTLTLAAERGAELDMEYRIIWPDGSLHWVHGKGQAFRDEAGRAARLVGTCQDITQRKEAEESARGLAEEMAFVDQVARIMTSTLEIDQVYERFAAELKKLVGFDRVMINIIDPAGEAFRYQQVAGLVYPGQEIGDTIPLEGSLTQQVMISRQPLVWSDIPAVPRSRGDETLREMGMRSAFLAPLNSKGRFIGTLSLSSRQAEAYRPREQAILERLARLIAPAVENAQLYEETIIEKERAAAALAELKTTLERLEAGKEALRREMLLKEEIHHRVKNNLQVISSLLYLQSNNVTDPATLEILRESQSRIKSIALVHEKLHMSADSERLDFAEYASELLADVFHTYGAHQNDIAIHTQIEEIFLGIDTAIPCGLIINELASNTLKHAFPGGMNGDVWVELRLLYDRTYNLVIRDNGVGLPQDFSLEKTRSLGLRLVQDLTRQLEGKMEIETGNGAAFHITFKELQYKERW